MEEGRIQVAAGIPRERLSLTTRASPERKTLVGAFLRDEFSTKGKIHDPHDTEPRPKTRTVNCKLQKGRR